MRSIRLSLVVYFLLLEAVALGAASWQVYHIAERGMATQQAAGRRLLAAKFEEQVKLVNDRFDEDLLATAHTIWNLYQRRVPDLTELLPVGLLSAGPSPQGHLLAPLWAVGSQRGTRLHGLLRRRLPAEMSFSDDALPRDAEGRGAEFVQIDSEWGATWRSRALAGTGLPFDPGRLTGNQIWASDDVLLPGGPWVRRVMLKQVPVAGGPRYRPEVSAGGRNEAAGPWVVISCARGTESRDVEVNRLSAERDEKMFNLEAMGADALEALAGQLLVIGVVTFLLTGVGGLGLVTLGLSPLRRLTDAVSRVNPRDFRLPLAGGALPRELDPIAGRLRETLEELRQAFEREKHAVADISHELRTPVTALLATLDVTLRKPRTAEEYRAAIVEARSAAGHLRQLVERILALARLDAGVARVLVEPVDVAHLIAQCVNLVRPLAAEKAVSLYANGPATLTWPTDPNKLREILINLLHNAIQYNRKGGSVRVSYGVHDGGLDLSVADTGIGIEADRLPHVFERFFRADPSREEAALHAGLGLSIVRGYAELLGGTVGITSTVGEGTTFRIRLPRRSAGEGREAA